MKYLLCSVLLLCGFTYSQSDFQNLTLSKYIELAAKNNYDLKKSAAIVSIQKKEKLKNVFLPSPELTLDYDFIPSGKKMSLYEERSLSISQEFEFPLKYFLKADKSNYLIKAAELNYLTTKNNFYREAKRAYFSALTNKYRLEIYREHVFSAEEFYNKSMIRKNSGEGSSIESLTAQIQLSESQSLYTSASTDLNASLINMSSLAGIHSYSDSITFADTIKYTPIKYSLEDILEIALKENSELKSNIQLNYSASVNHQLAVLGLIPDFNFRYSKQSIAGNNNYYGISFGASIPLWFMFNQSSDISTSAIENEIAGFNVSHSRIEISNKIKKAYDEVKTKNEQAKLYQSSLMPQANEIYNLAMINYLAGESSYLELLQARQTLLSIKINYINNLLNYYLALIELENSINVPSFKILE